MLLTNTLAWATDVHRPDDITVRLLSEIPELEVHPPAGAFYIFAKSRSGISSDVMLAKAAEYGVAIRGGNEYGPGGEGYIRLAFSSPREDIEEGIARLKTMFEELTLKKS